MPFPETSADNPQTMLSYEKFRRKPVVVFNIYHNLHTNE